MTPVSVVLVEDNDAFRETLELLFGMRDEVEVVGSVATGDDASALCASVRPDVVLMDYRMPGLNGAEATRAVLVACPEARVVCLSASVTQQEIDEVLRGRSRRVCDEGRGLRPPRRDRLRGCGMKLTTENTAVVLDSTADFPDAPERFPNFRVVPLYVRFGDESFRDYDEITPDEFYERLRPPPSCRRPPSRRRAISSRSTRSSRLLRTDSLAADLLDALRHVRERADGGRDARRRRCG